MSAKIYTKTGDFGNTSLIGGTKVPKSHIRIEAYGTIDELNSYIGLTRDHLQDEHFKKVLKNIQDKLFTIGSQLARDPDKEIRMQLPRLQEFDIDLLEKEIDKMDEELPPVRNFILPGGHIAISTTHITRCICRRAERCCVNMKELGLPIEPIIIKYLNRLSDYLFILARHIGYKLNIDEVIWNS